MAVILLSGGLPGSSPDTFAGLQLWFEAAENVYTDLAGTVAAADGEAVRSWKDKKNNWLIPDGGLGTSPLLDTDLVNGRPALVFDGTNDRFASTSNDADSFMSATAHTMFVVARYAAATPSQNRLINFFDGTNSTQTIGNTAASAQARVENWDGSADVAVKAATLTNWNIFSGMHSGGTLYCGVNDARTASMGSVASGNTSFGANTNLIIHNPPVTFAAFDIAEIIYFNVDVAEADRQAIETRLSFKYGIALPY